MKAYNRMFTIVTVIVLALFVIVNGMVLTRKTESGRPYRVEISRLEKKIEQGGQASVNLAECEYVTAVVAYEEEFYNTDSDYVIREINGVLYRFDYKVGNSSEKTEWFITVNTVLGIISVVLFVVIVYIKQKILLPFEQFAALPYELSKGNLAASVKESKNRFFGRFLWGMDMLRENMEQQKERELSLQRDKKMLLLSLSHDIKTPLSAIKLYAKALAKGLYADREKQLEIADSISAKADEIEGYVSQIITASREDFLDLTVKNGEFYLSELVTKLQVYYKEKLALVKTEFCVAEYTDCLINGDFDRSVEVLQNIMENAIKYGDGRSIRIVFCEEDGCTLITVVNSGCSLLEHELPHLFESFWRGTNAEKEKGSGLGLYICRQLMRKMNGEIFAELKDGMMCVTTVFGKA